MFDCGLCGVSLIIDGCSLLEVVGEYLDGIEYVLMCYYVCYDDEFIISVSFGIMFGWLVLWLLCLVVVYLELELIM